MSSVTLRLLLPPSVGAARARARAELLDQSLRADLAEAVEIEVASGYGELASRVEAGGTDLVWMPPTICARLEPQLRRIYKCVRYGGTTYRSALVTRQGEITSIEQLRGKRAAWVDRLSVGGYLLGAAELRRAGIDPERDLASESFVGSYPDALAALLENEADFAAISVRDETLGALRDALAAHGGKPAADRLISVRTTRSSPNDAVGVTRALDERRAERLARRVFETEGTRSRAALCLALEAEGFTRADPEEYEALRRMLPRPR
ncbi:MAG: phosphate/phosphite/phosphonate ABC transporter substrate-binding protein [Sandaracinaceae bacterium]